MYNILLIFLYYNISIIYLSLRAGWSSDCENTTNVAQEVTREQCITNDWVGYFHKHV